MRAFKASLFVLCGAVAGYFLTGALALAFLLVSGIDEDDPRFIEQGVPLAGISLMLVGGCLGWRVWRSWKGG